MSMFKKILVMCPGGAVTGGPEALHHLVHLLRGLGLDAYMVYTPEGKTFQTPEAYKGFNVKVGEYEDAPGNLIIFPEVEPMKALAVQHAKAAMWWLSLDNFLERRHVNRVRDFVRYWKGVIKGRRPRLGVVALKDIIHFSQSHYSGEYLASKGIAFTNFFEPINERFLDPQLDPGVSGRVDEILYNPSKGKKLTSQLIARYPQYKFTPLKGFSREDLSKKFATAKIYIDFGHHPGRDRLPREAAMHGCCVVTGQLGAAQNSVDIPIADSYKLDSFAPDFERQFGALVNDIFEHFEVHHARFASYRARIMSEPQTFQSQIAAYFCP